MKFLHLHPFFPALYTAPAILSCFELTEMAMLDTWLYDSRCINMISSVERESLFFIFLLCSNVPLFSSPSSMLFMFLSYKYIGFTNSYFQNWSSDETQVSHLKILRYSTLSLCIQDMNHNVCAFL